MSTIDEDYGKYLDFAGHLEEELAERHGQATAAMLFRRMSQKQFQKFLEAAAVDPIKRRWIAKFRAGYEQVMAERRAA